MRDPWGGWWGVNPTPTGLTLLLARRDQLWSNRGFAAEIKEFVG